MQQGTQKVLTRVEGVDLKMDFEKGENIDAKTLELNDIGTISLTLAQSIFSEPYKKNNALGSFILIDQKTFNTAGVGFIS